MTTDQTAPTAAPSVSWPPEEKVKLVGSLSRPEVIGAGVAMVIVVAGIAAGSVLVAAVATLPVLAWTFATHHGTPVRTRITARMRWVARRDRVWSIPIRGRSGIAPCLRGVRLLLATDTGGTHQSVAGVIAGPGGSYTVVFPVEGSSLAFLPAGEQTTRFAGWGAVLGSLCTADDSVVVPDRVAWVDVHRAGDPGAFVAYHQIHGVVGPSTGEYAAYLAGADVTGSTHRVLVAVTLVRARQLKRARRNGHTGTAQQIMITAAIHTGEDLARQLAAAGYHCGLLLTPADLGRVIVEAGDPFAPRYGQPTTLERFALAERYGPEQVDVDRHHVAIDGAYHRVFAVAWPKIPVGEDWLWKPLGTAGPKIVTTVCEPIPAYRATAMRDALTTRATSNNRIAATRGRVRTVDTRKAAALAAAERKVSDGHHELDGYALIVITAATVEELGRRCQLLRQTLHEAGRAGVRELTGTHDVGWAAALPLGIHVAPSVE